MTHPRAYGLKFGSIAFRIKSSNGNNLVPINLARLSLIKLIRPQNAGVHILASTAVCLIFPIRGNVAKLHRINVASTNSLSASRAIHLRSKEDKSTPQEGFPR